MPFWHDHASWFAKATDIDWRCGSPHAREFSCPFHAHTYLWKDIAKFENEGNGGAEHERSLKLDRVLYCSRCGSSFADVLPMPSLTPALVDRLPSFVYNSCIFHYFGLLSGRTRRASGRGLTWCLVSRQSSQIRRRARSMTTSLLRMMLRLVLGVATVGLVLLLSFGLLQGPVWLFLLSFSTFLTLVYSVALPIADRISLVR
jgi:hypothetical protein